ncbi:hypothetical protein PR048_010300 [Dryococelus australis]|uniref:DUF4371 domain-containing protein n=1 Tax=Dryococelus australis TaxID=614101 RepID=A0ABQ9I2E1_9NEOP|nr:hypothetical protein PR048_010300 [Dryococelus australis]
MLEVSSAVFFFLGAGDFPTVITLREKYVPLVAKEGFATVKAEVVGKFITVLADDTRDKRGNYNSVLTFVSDGAHMSKCCECLQVIFGDALHYWKILVEFNPVVIKLKAAFQNTRKRKHLYTQFLTERYPRKLSSFLCLYSLSGTAGCMCQE